MPMGWLWVRSRSNPNPSHHCMDGYQVSNYYPSYQAANYNLGREKNKAYYPASWPSLLWIVLKSVLILSSCSTCGESLTTNSSINQPCMSSTVFNLSPWP